MKDLKHEHQSIKMGGWWGGGRWVVGGFIGWVVGGFMGWVGVWWCGWWWGAWWGGWLES